jgi:transposase
VRCKKTRKEFDIAINKNRESAMKMLDEILKKENPTKEDYDKHHEVILNLCRSIEQCKLFECQLKKMLQTNARTNESKTLFI